MTGKYDDIIHLSHHVSTKHPQMPLRDRAAQFSPFAALTGHADIIRETARTTETRVELSKSVTEVLSAKLDILRDIDHAKISVVYFVPDNRKSGGTYTTVTGTVKKIDEIEKCVVLDDGTRIPMEDIVEISGEVFGDVDEWE